MKQEIIANCTGDETRIAVIEDGRLVELDIERKESEKIVGNIYKGKVENVLPGMASAFVNIGLEKNAYLYVSDALNQNQEQANASLNQLPIEQLVKKGDTILVQVAKEAIGTKGVKISMDIALPGRFLVYMPFQSVIGVSKNIEDEPERKRLKELLESLRPKRGGLIARTEAESAQEKELKREIRYLVRLWENIQKRAKELPAPALLHKDLGLTFHMARDVLSEETALFMLDSKSEFQEVQEFVRMLSPELVDRVKFFEGKTPIFEAFHVEKELEKLFHLCIRLPSGGSIIIQEAESLCAIDVNTGSFTGKDSQEETVTQTNIEAAEEIARQLRLRNIGGIIVIDFIDMRREVNRRKVTEALIRATAKDRAKIKILPITRLGLVEMTRERKRESILSTLCRSCPECDGSGRILSDESLYVRVKKEILKLTQGKPQGHLRVVIHPEYLSYFQQKKENLEKNIGMDLELQADAALPYQDYKIILE